MAYVTKAFLTSNILLCESIEVRNGLQCALRIIDIFQFENQRDSANFKALTTVTGTPGDQTQHVIVVQMIAADEVVVSTATPLLFTYGYSLDPLAPGGFRLVTNFKIDPSTLHMLGTFMIRASVDGIPAAETPITLRWK